MVTRRTMLVSLMCVAMLISATVGSTTSTALARKTAPRVAPRIDPSAGGNRLDVVVHLRVGLPRTLCEGTATLLHRFVHLPSVRLPRLRTGSKGGALWHWYAGVGVPAGLLRVRVRCKFPDGWTPWSVARKFVEAGPPSERRPRSLVAPGSMEVGRWNPPSTRPGSGGGDAFVFYPVGQCTWYVAKLRRDLRYFPGRSGDAKNWIASARRYGYPTGKTPRAGAVAVFQPQQYGAGIYGHVAYVIEVAGTLMTVKEANFHGRGIGSVRQLPWRSVQFIYEDGDEAPMRPLLPVPPASPPASPALKTTTARILHTATELKNGKVLVTGGQPGIGGYGTKSAELYDPASNAWTPAQNMAFARSLHTATRLNDGEVLVTGGQTALNGKVTKSAELYDPESDAWKPVPDVTFARRGHTATLLESGKVLIAGGQAALRGSARESAELYDPTSNTWKPARPMTSARSLHTATPLKNGKVLVTGGQPRLEGDATKSAELYDPESNTWKPVQPMTSVRSLHTATLLEQSGQVLVTGGLTGIHGITGQTTLQGIARASAELYDPESNRWTQVQNMMSIRGGHTATWLTSGKVLVTGGQLTLLGPASASAELFDPANKTWTPVPNLASARSLHTATLLTSSGKVLITDGQPSLEQGATTSAELYDPATALGP